jgi:hypothetical protein
LMTNMIAVDIGERQLFSSDDDGKLES